MHSVPGHAPLFPLPQRVPLHFSDDPVHRAHGLDRVLPDRGLRRQHDGVGAVEDRVGDIGGLGPRGPRVVHHRFQHLGRGDHRLALVIRFADQPLLDERHLLERQLDAEVTTRHHHGIRHGYDLFEIVERSRLLDFRHEFRGAAGEGAELLDVLGPADETQREVVDADLQGILHVLPILLGERRRRHLDPGEVHSLVGRQNTAVDDAAAHARSVDAGDLHRQQAVVQQDPGADAGVSGEAFVRRGQLIAPRDVLGGEHHLLTRRELPRRGQIADANARALEVEQDGDRQVHLLRDAPGGGDPLRTQLGGAVGRIDAQHVGSGLEQRADARLVPGRGSQGRDDLSAANRRAAVRSVIHKCTRLWRCGKLAGLQGNTA